MTSRSRRPGRRLWVVATTLACVVALSGFVPAAASGRGSAGGSTGSAANNPARVVGRLADRLSHRLSHGAAVRALDRVRDLLSGRPDARARLLADRHGDLTTALRDLWQGRASLSSAQRRAADRLLARPTDPGGDQLCPDGCIVRLPADQTRTRGTRHFLIHYTSEAGRNHASASMVTAVAAALEHSYRAEVGGMGFRAPVSDTGVPDIDGGNPDDRFDVFLADTGRFGVYGYTAIDPDSRAQEQPAYLVLDNNFSKSQFCPTGRHCTSPLDSMRVTVAHEFFHAIQYAYDVYEDTWLLEGSAVWMEDEVYDGINDYRQYVANSPIRHPRIPVDHDGFADVYGAFTLFKFLTRSGYMHVGAAVRQIWQRAARPDVYSLQAVDQVIRAHHHGPRTAFGRFGVWNTLPPGSYPGERAGYGAPHYWRTRTLGHRHHSTGWLTTGLRHLASATVRLKPGRGLPARQRVRVQVNLPARSHDPIAYVQVRRTNGRVFLHKVSLDRHGNGRVTVWFSRKKVRSVVVVATNGSTRLETCPGGGEPYTCGGHGVYDGGTFNIGARLT